LIQFITVITPLRSWNIKSNASHSSKIVIDLSSFDALESNSFDIIITFSERIAEFRDHDYTWKKCNATYIANQFSPKIVKLENGQIVQANLTNGIWEMSHKVPTVLFWRFNPENAAPFASYLGNENRKTIYQARQKFDFTEMPALLFPKNEPVEVSRSRIPFSAIACFTDHCDFDTAENLSLQREFFNEHQIKITKGFFLNHFSKREDNASYQNQKGELLKWKESGHELCYHSLSQSLKSNEKSFEDFKQFTPPFSKIKVWIDHGFQPYNFSLLRKGILTDREFEQVLQDKKIVTLWNYIDSGTATTGVLNQFDTRHFTLSSFYKGNKDLGLIKKIQLIVKNIIFHYYNDENLIFKYRLTVFNFKKLFFQKNLKSFFPLVNESLKLGVSILSVLLFWNTKKNRPYKLAKYSPIVFKHTIAEEEFYVFQTLEILDFKKSLAPENIKKLIRDSGVFIAHTYFSVPMHYHKGRMFSTPAIIDREVFENFKFLGDKIKSNEIWNPTLTELIEYWSGFEKLIFDIDHEGNLFEKSNTGLQIRKAI
jgi:hypothetical protein